MAKKRVSKKAVEETDAAVATEAPPKKKVAHSKVKPRPVQTLVPGLEQERDEVLEELATKYRHARDSRMQWGVDEIDLKKRIMDRMHKINTKLYRSQDAEVEIEVVPTEETVKVRTPKRDAPDQLAPKETAEAQG